MKLSFAIGFSLAAILSAGIPAAAQGPDMPPAGPGMGGPGFGMHRPPMERSLGLRGGRWWNEPAMVEKLKLTDDQRKSMDEILLDHRKDIVDKRAAVEKAELDLEPLMQEDQPNESRVLSQIDKVAQARADLEKANARFLLAIRAKLSPEQWKDLKAARAERMDRHWHEHGDGRGIRNGPGEGNDDKPQGPPPPNGSGPGPQGSLNELPAPQAVGAAADTGSR